MRAYTESVVPPASAKQHPRQGPFIPATMGGTHLISENTDCA